MKKVLLSIIILSLFLFNISAREYSYLNPPSISIMDFDVNMSEVKVEDSENKFDSKDYYGKLINQTLLTILIQKNSSENVFIRGGNIADVYANDKEFDNVSYFPTLLKIYDKKYVETALDENNYTVGDLYSKNAEAFSYADLDFVVLGNVYETQNKIGLNVRVLNTYRGEELFSYIGFIKDDLSNLNEICDDISENIISDILKNYCSQFIVKETDSVPEGISYLLFCQSRQEIDNEDNRISTNDTFKKDIAKDRYYWILPGDYVFTVYSEKNKTVREVPVTIDPREIKLVELTEEQFKVDTGSITIGGITPTDAYSINIKEKVKDAEYLWEIGKDLSSTLQNHTFTFRQGEFDYTHEDDQNPLWVYKPFSNEIVISNLMISKYDVTVTPVAESVSRKSITGIVVISSKEIETSDPVFADLDSEKDIELGIDDFNINKEFDVDTYKQTRITFLFNPAFSGEETELFVTGLDSDGYLIIKNIEKLVIEDEYNEKEWGDLAGQSIFIEMYQAGEYYSSSLPYADIEAVNDEIVVVDFKKVIRKKASTGSNSSASEPEGNGGSFWDKLFGN